MCGKHVWTSTDKEQKCYNKICVFEALKIMKTKWMNCNCFVTCWLLRLPVCQAELKNNKLFSRCLFMLGPDGQMDSSCAASPACQSERVQLHTHFSDAAVWHKPLLPIGGRLHTQVQSEQLLAVTAAPSKWAQPVTPVNLRGSHDGKVFRPCPPQIKNKAFVLAHLQCDKPSSLI